MKKNIFALIIGLSVSTFATADAFEPNADGLEIIETTDCALLNEGVRISMSKDVEGGYECNTGTNQIAVSFCHPNGKKSNAGTNNNYYSLTSAGGKTHIANDAPCLAATAATKASTLSGELPVEPTDPGEGES